jgi:fructose-bisphosphate aldolase class II
VARRLGEVKGARLLLAATFGNVHGVYKLGQVKLKPSILKDCQEAVKKNMTEGAIYLVFHGEVRFASKKSMKPLIMAS